MKKGRSSSRGINCEAIRDEAYRLLDGKVSPAKRRALKSHLTTCAPCFSQVEFIRLMRFSLRGCVANEPCPGGLVGRIRAAIAARMSSGRKVQRAKA